MKVYSDTSMRDANIPTNLRSRNVKLSLQAEAALPHAAWQQIEEAHHQEAHTHRCNGEEAGM